MIVTSLLGFFGGIFTSILTGIGNAVSLPSDLINVLATITGYGAWIVGSDLLLTIFACVTFWTSTKIVIGLFTYIWELLPLT